MVLIGIFSNGDNTDMTAKMQPATLPVVTLTTDDHTVNPMHGYLSTVDVNYMRASVLPLYSDRTISYKINTFKNKAWDIRFEVRSIDGKGLVENTAISDYAETDGTISGTIQLKDLIMEKKEYMLVFVMETASGTARYYSRVVWTEDESRYNVDKEIDFVTSFSKASFSKTEAQEYSKYLESNSEGDNTTFSRINIHSSFNQFTWGDMNVTKHTDPDIYITDLHSQTGSFLLTYRVTVKDGTISRNYNINETYRVRFTKDRIYLLNFERTMNYIFDSSAYSLGTNSISLNISDPDIELKESSGGTAFAFVSENRLYAYNNTDSKLAYLFGFYDSDNDDIRTRWDRNSIKILNVDEAGNVRFAVAGYMNRGIHEGQVGIAVYDYDASINAVEEKAFVESAQSPEILMSYVNTLSYASGSDIFYVMLDQNIYEIDLISRQSKAVVEDIGAGSYKISDSGRTIAWQADDLKSLHVMNLNTRVTSEVEAETGDYVKVLGFMGEDLVFGMVHSSDVQMDQMGNPIYAMYAIKIHDSEGNVLENYHPEGVYVTDVNIVDNQIKLTRVQKNPDTGVYESTYEDQIMSTLKPETGSNVVTQVSVDVYEKLTQITTKNEIKAKQVRVLSPDQTLFEGDRNAQVQLKRDTGENPFYYVYDLFGCATVYTDPAEAVQAAGAAPGVVLDDSNRYVWVKGNLLRSNQIMSLTKKAESYENMTSKNPVAVCLDLVLDFEGINRNVEALIAAGDSAPDILRSSMPDARVLELDGCSLQSILYYVNMDIPVMAMLNDGDAMLVIGFNDLNTVLMDPKTGSVYKYGMNDSQKLFEDNGNHFITYLMEDK